MRSLLSEILSLIAADNFRSLALFTYAIAALCVFVALIYRVRDELSKTFEAGADWAEFKAAKRRARRKNRRRALRRYDPPPARAPHLRVVKPNQPKALEALRRNAEAAADHPHICLVNPPTRTQTPIKVGAKSVRK